MKPFRPLLPMFSGLIILLMAVACVPGTIEAPPEKNQASATSPGKPSLSTATLQQVTSPTLEAPTSTLPPQTATPKEIIPVTGLPLTNIIQNALYIPKAPYSRGGDFPELHCSIGETGRMVGESRLLVAVCYDLKGNVVQPKVPLNRELTVYLTVGRIVAPGSSPEGEKDMVSEALTTYLGQPAQPLNQCYPTMSVCVLRASQSGLFYFMAIINRPQANAPSIGIRLISFFRNVRKATDGTSVITLDVETTDAVPTIIPPTVEPTVERRDNGGMNFGDFGGGAPPSNLDVPPNNNNN